MHFAPGPRSATNGGYDKLFTRHGMDAYAHKKNHLEALYGTIRAYIMRGWKEQIMAIYQIMNGQD